MKVGVCSSKDEATNKKQQRATMVSEQCLEVVADEEILKSGTAVEINVNKENNRYGNVPPNLPPIDKKASDEVQFAKSQNYLRPNVCRLNDLN